MCRIDHNPVWLSRLLCQRREYLVEHTKPTPADEAIIECLVRAIIFGRVAPAQAVADDMNDAADHPTVVYSPNPVRQRKIRLDQSHLAVGQPEQILHSANTSHHPRTTERRADARKLTGPEPSITVVIL